MLLFEAVALWVLTCCAGVCAVAGTAWIVLTVRAYGYRTQTSLDAERVARLTNAAERVVTTDELRSWRSSPPRFAPPIMMESVSYQSRLASQQNAQYTKPKRSMESDVASYQAAISYPMKDASVLAQMLAQNVHEYPELQERDLWKQYNAISPEQARSLIEQATDIPREEL